jgi:hypothetical protein
VSWSARCGALLPIDRRARAIREALHQIDSMVVEH